MANKAENPGKTMKIAELPIYDAPQVKVRLEPEEIGMVREGVTVVRKRVWKCLDSAQNITDSIRNKYEIGKAHTQATIDYIQNNEGIIPRITVISVSGLVGVLAGYRGGPLRKTVLGLFGVGAATALCYPHETVAVTVNQYEKLKNTVQGKRSESSSDTEKSDIKSS